MRGLTPIERRALMPIGTPGESVPEAIIDALIEQGRAQWIYEPNRMCYVLEPTELGYLALRLPINPED
jgi:hypothetical protein